MCLKDVKLEKKVRLTSAFLLVKQDIFLFLTPLTLTPLTSCNNTSSQVLFSVGRPFQRLIQYLFSFIPSSFSLHIHPLSYFQVVSDRHRIPVSAPHTLTGIAPLLCQILTYHQFEILLTIETEQSHAPIIPACDFHMRFSSTRQNWRGPLTFSFT